MKVPLTRANWLFCFKNDIAGLETFIKSIDICWSLQKDRSALHLAAGQGHVDVIAALLDADVNVDAPDKVRLQDMNKI